MTVQLAEVYVAPQDTRITRVCPFDLDVPDATFIFGIELDVNVAPARQRSAELVVRPVVVVWSIDPEKLYPIARAVDDGDVALIFCKGSTHRRSSEKQRNKKTFMFKLPIIVRRYGVAAALASYRLEPRILINSK